MTQETAAPIDQAVRNSRRWLMVILLFFGMLINFVDRGNLSIAAEHLILEFGVSHATMGWLFSSFALAYACFQLPAGWLVDRFGIRWLYALAFAFWSMATVCIGLSQTIAQILALRILLGISEALAPPASLSYIRRHFKSHELGIPTAIYTAGMTLGSAGGAWLGAHVVASHGWRQLFVFTGIGGLIWLLPWLLFSPRTQPHAQIPAEPPPQRVASPRIASLLRIPTFWGISVGAFFYSYYSYFLLTWLPSYFVKERGFSYERMGEITSSCYLGIMLISFTSAFIADRMIAHTQRPITVRKFFVSAGFLIGSSILFTPLIESPTISLSILIVSMLGTGLASSNFWALTQAVAPKTMVGRVIGYQNMICSLGGFVSPILTGYLVDHFKDFRIAIVIAGSSLLVAIAAYLLLLRQRDAEAFEQISASQQISDDGLLS